MAKGNPLQQQLLKAGLVKKSKVAEVAPGSSSEDDAYYAQFQVPDDLVW